MLNYNKIYLQNIKFQIDSLKDYHLFIESNFQKGLEEIQSKVENMKHSPIAQVFESGYRELRKLPSQDRTEEGFPEISNIENFAFLILLFSGSME